jgi:CubicO group peptidase (beta-lactamase class C family)
MRRLLPICLLFVAPAVASQRAATIDAVFASWSAPTSPGCAVGVFEKGAISFAKGYGSASLEHGVPITPETVFYAGSVSKQFTAMTAALAMKQGKLAYEDSIRKYLPELPAYAEAIRIRHLLHHTSGLRDYNTLLSIAGKRDEEAWDNRVVLQITARQKALNFEPGSEYLYSNTGYTLLATIVERATGVRFAEFADQHIFKPLGMTATHFHTDARRLVPHRALAYGGRAGAWTLDTPINERAGAGGLYTTIPDLQKWDENFYTGKVGGKEVIDQLLTRGVLNDGKRLPYAWGLQIGEYEGQGIVEHSGSLGGYRAHIFRVPSAHTSVALLCNTSTATTSTLVRQVADAVLRNRLTSMVMVGDGSDPGTAVVPQPHALSPTALASYAGTYYSPEVDAVFTISFKDGRLTLMRETDAAPVALEPFGATFRARGLTLIFQQGAAGSTDRFTVDAGRVRAILFERRQ